MLHEHKTEEIPGSSTRNSSIPSNYLLLMFLFRLLVSCLVKFKQKQLCVWNKMPICSNGNCEISGPKKRCRESFSCHDIILKIASIDLTKPGLTRLFSITCRFWHVVRLHIRTDDSVYIYICMKCKQRFLLTNLISFCFLKMTMQTIKVLRFPLIGLCIFIDSGSHGMPNKMKKNNSKKRFVHTMVVLMPISTYKIRNRIQ